MLRATGSSPLARGTPSIPAAHDTHPRFIHAGAGNTPKAYAMASRSAVHPRWRGEHIGGKRRLADRIGSSPLARGTPGQALLLGGDARFIPAGAGNTPEPLDPAGQTSVHPRWRGEHHPSPSGQS